MKSPTVQRHGSSYGYRKGCRCGECTAANSAAEKASYQRRRDKLLAQKRAAYRAAPEKFRAISRDFRKRTGKTYTDPEKRRWQRMLSRYGLTPRAYHAMLESQNHCCALCFRPVVDRSPELALVPNIDHDHETGKTRELLCMHCNNGLGAFRDNIEVMSRAIEYIARHRR